MEHAGLLSQLTCLACVGEEGSSASAWSGLERDGPSSSSPSASSELHEAMLCCRKAPRLLKFRCTCSGTGRRQE